ncbi:MAG: PIN domain-containing protein [Clostridia bacterium]|nr:PIN domain-containing protein [Clostridia bacterium]
MEMYKVFLDANILLDYILDTRENVSINSEIIFEKIIEGEIECWVAAHSLTNIFYILRKDYDAKSRKKILQSICKLCKVQEINQQMVDEALRLDVDDFEDALQLVCAKRCGANEIITRDKQWQ